MAKLRTRLRLAQSAKLKDRTNTGSDFVIRSLEGEV